MKALSILQPWAWLIVHGHKDIENRRWATRFRGEFLVHAGKRWGREQHEDLAAVRDAFPSLVLPEVFDLGCVVGSARIVGCVDCSDSDWFTGPFGFELVDGQPARAPIPYRGQLGFFEVPYSVTEVIYG